MNHILNFIDSPTYIPIDCIYYHWLQIKKTFQKAFEKISGENIVTFSYI